MSDLRKPLDMEMNMTLLPLFLLVVLGIVGIVSIVIGASRGKVELIALGVICIVAVIAFMMMADKVNELLRFDIR